MNHPFVFVQWCGEYNTQTVCLLLKFLLTFNVCESPTVPDLHTRGHWCCVHANSFPLSNVEEATYFSCRVLITLRISPPPSSHSLYRWDRTTVGQLAGALQCWEGQQKENFLPNGSIKTPVTFASHEERMRDCSWQDSCLLHCSVVYRAQSPAVCICHREPLSRLAFVSEINRSGYHTPVLSLHICRNNRQQMGNKGFNIHTLSGRLLV